MRKIYKIVIGLCCIYFTPPLIAQERTVDNVKDVVCTFFATDSGTLSRGSATYRNNIEVTSIKRDNTTYLYAVNMPGKGWAIVSNEQRYKTIIGYSTDSHFETNPDNQPDALKLLLEFHMNMIDSLRKSSSTFSSRFSSNPFLSAINFRDGETSFLLKRHGEENLWRQKGNIYLSGFDCDKVYNKFCPTANNGSCGRTVVGCVAVALAQVLWYWRWPDYALINDTIHLGIPSGSVRRHYYDWDNMPASISDSSPIYQANMVAGLLRDCGYASHMLYGDTSSESGPIRLQNALENTFHFHVDRQLEMSLIDDSYEPILRYEIQCQRPVICTAGNASLEGHTFVIDGYNSLSSSDMFHINWGWGYGFNSWYDIDFNGYTFIRTFFTELYPDCAEREESVTSIDVDTIENGKDVTLYSANNVSLSQLTVSNGGHLNVSVGGTITLGSGFKAQLGSAVKLAPNYNCSTGTSVAPVSISKRKHINKIDSTKKTNLSVSPNPAVSEINIQSEEPINTISLFNINGQEVLQTKQTQIDISHLPNGIYIIRAIAEGGEILQKKLIHE